MSRVVNLYSPFYKHKSFRSFRANFLFQLWKFFNCINCCKTKTNKKVRRFFIKISWFSKFIKIEFCWRLVFKIFSIHKPSLGSCEVPHSLGPIGYRLESDTLYKWRIAWNIVCRPFPYFSFAIEIILLLFENGFISSTDMRS